ncbi:hypothetical protein GCM10011316_38560 [Roseibium aquae]|uniref:AlpA family transcriptional regulator n=1 Tax=Roseibium aquae TaxID=1323746 RepID=A0A916TN10_9HYPH|nr:hypothetical protein GCM10011316_38560 [Roseibium aquae]
MQETVLRLPDVVKRTGLKKSSIYNYMTAGDFPTPFKIGARANGWSEQEINAWIESRKACRGGAQ